MAGPTLLQGCGPLSAWVSALFYLPGHSNTPLLPWPSIRGCARVMDWPQCRRSWALLIPSLLRACHETDTPWCWTTVLCLGRQAASNPISWKGRWVLLSARKEIRGVLWWGWVDMNLLWEMTLCFDTTQPEGAEIFIDFLSGFRIFLNVSASFYTCSFVFTNSSNMWVLQE